MILPGSSIAKTAAINKETATVASGGVINLEEDGDIKLEEEVPVTKAFRVGKAMAVKSVGAVKVEKKEEVEAKAESSLSGGAAKVDKKEKVEARAESSSSVGTAKVEKKEHVEVKAESSSSVGAAKVDDKREEVEAKDESFSDGEPAPIVAFDSVKQKKEEEEKMEGAFGVAECRFSDAGEPKRRRRAPSVP